jgi:CheY-like chemotaxis protein
MRQGDEAARFRRGEGRILAVDDTSANLTALCALLEPMGYEIVTAESGPKALACAAEGEFAVVLLDVMMPGMDGFETLRRLSDVPGFKGTPVILLTAYEPQPRMIEHAYEMGAADYVFKPIAPAVLRAKVEVFVSLYRRGLELGRRRDALVAKDRQISILAHDLRSPLSAITMVAASMVRTDASAAIRENAERILRAARRMDKMTGDLLDFARISAGGLPIDRAPVDLAVVVRDTVEEIRTAHVGGSIDLDVADGLAGSWD